MNYRTLGRTGLKVSEIGLGALEIGRNWPLWRIGMDGFERPGEKDALELVYEAIDLGINFIDTAPAYVDSERLLGLALKGKRDKIVLATKCGEWFDGNKSVYDYSASETLRFIENSLRLLQTDRIDLLQIHSGNLEVVQRGETLGAMKRAQAQGKVRFLGISLDSEDAALAALESGEYDCLQLSYNLLFRTMGEKVIPQAKARNLGVIVKDGLVAGRLTPRNASINDESLKKRVAEFDARAKTLAMTLPEYAIRFVLGNPSISTVILGTKSRDHLRGNVAYSDDPDRSLKILEREVSK